MNIVLRQNPAMLTVASESGGHGGKNVAAAATPLQLAAATPCRTVIITARPGNGGKIAVGFDNTVRATAGAELGMILAAGATITLAVTDLSKVWIDASVNGEGVSYTYLV